MPRTNYLLILIFCILQIGGQDVKDIINKRRSHKPKEINDVLLPVISAMSDENHINELLDNILIPRVVGTEGHEKVKDYIVNEMKKLNWHVELDVFQDETPNFGVLTFSNIIAKLNPNAERYLLLACHYDSKYFPNEEFLGATDSAVPCAMLINLAKTMAGQFESIKNRDDLSIMFVFFDGEEAFEEWTAKDSIYGARHLAKKWEEENFLQRIDLFVLLDLLGAPDPSFYSLFQDSGEWYARLRRAENKLSRENLLKSHISSGISTQNSNIMFNAFSFHAGIEDDHKPFHERQVPILHIIPVPFPDVWHKVGDNREAIDLTTVEDLLKIFRVFIIEYLHIEII